MLGRAPDQAPLPPAREEELARLAEDHATTMRRVERLVRLARIDAEVMARTAADRK